MIALLHHSVDDGAERAPERDAFRCDGEALTYAELSQKSSQLAAVLRERGVRRGDRVAIYMTKSLQLPVAVYGVLKAGAAYVPIDPAAPRERIETILRDCGIRHLITGESRARKATRLQAETPELQTVVGASGEASVAWDEVFAASALTAAVHATSLDLAYVMYTSGSTGAPKGLMHTHDSGLAYARLSAREYGVGPEDRLGNHSPLHFDMSTFEFLTAPLAGATTVLVPEEAMLFPRRVAELIEVERLTFWYSVPLALIQLLDRGSLEDRDHSSLRWVLFGGEPFPPKHLARLARHWPQVRFSNSYGPAEVNQCTAHHLSASEIDGERPVPLGEIWPGADGRIVDEHGEDVADGASGELLISAPTMMRGYWGRPDLNAVSFVEVELHPGFTRRYYRTGDLVRRSPDGLLEFLGRRDRQVKVRGYRVELDELEALLCAEDGVAEAAAVALPSGGGDASLVAAALPETGGEIDGTVLRRRLAERLPGYAVPSRVEVMDALPRTGSDKIDRPALARQLAATSPSK